MPIKYNLHITETLKIGWSYECERRKLIFFYLMVIKGTK